MNNNFIGIKALRNGADIAAITQEVDTHMAESVIDNLCVLRPVKNSYITTSANVTFIAKNLLPYPYYHSSGASNGITYTVRSDGTVNVVGTATGASVFYFCYPLTLPRGTYTLSGCPSGGGAGIYGLRLKNVEKNTNIYEYGGGRTFRLNHTTDIQLALNIWSGATINAVISPVISFGTTALDYTKYSTASGTSFEVGDNDYVLIRSENVVNISYVPNENHKLIGKSMFNFGDSIFNGGVNGGYGIDELIVDVFNCDTYKYSVGGARVSNASENNVPAQIDAVTNTVIPDVVCVNGGTNDNSSAVVAGAVSDSYDIATYNPTTYAGGLEISFYKIRDKWPEAKIVFMTVHHNNKNRARQEAYYEVLKAVCRKWSVIIADVYAEGGLNGNIPYYRDAYTVDSGDTGSGDTIHPNTLAYHRFYLPVLTKAFDKISA